MWAVEEYIAEISTQGLLKVFFDSILDALPT